MKTFLFCLTLALSSGYVYAQQDTVTIDQPEPHQPQGQYGTQRVPQPAGELKEDRIEVELGQVPPAMRDELNANPTYAGWEEGNIFFEKNTDQYIVHVVRENTTHTFRFDREGNAIRTDAPLDSPGKRQ